jgi:hypothetical protein
MKKVILASVSSICYHATTPYKLLDILKDNKIHLSSDLGTKADQRNVRKKFEPYFFSMSRVRYGGFLRSFGKNWAGLVNLVIDGQKLNEKYHGYSVDYWGPEYKTMNFETDMRLRNDENEDRIFSPKPFIEPATNYIKEIHLFISERANKMFFLKEEDTSTEEEALKDGRMYREIIKFCEVRKIKLFMYANFEAFKLLDKRRTVPLNRFSRSQSSGDLSAYIEILETKDIRTISGAAEERLYRCYISPDESRTVLDNEIHNSKSGDRSEKMMVDNFILAMRKLKLKSTKEVINYLASKYDRNK